MKIKNIAHLAFRTKDLFAALDFYCNKLGFEEKFRLEDKRWNLKIVYIKINENQFIELFPVEDEINIDRSVSYQHLCLEVEDINSLIEDLRNKGVNIDQEVSLGLDNNYQAWIRDPDGNPIELMEYGVNSLQRQ